MLAIACGKVCDESPLSCCVLVLQKRFCCSALQVPDMWINDAQTWKCFSSPCKSLITFLFNGVFVFLNPMCCYQLQRTEVQWTLKHHHSARKLRCSSGQVPSALASIKGQVSGNTKLASLSATDEILLCFSQPRAALCCCSREEMCVAGQGGPEWSKLLGDARVSARERDCGHALVSLVWLNDTTLGQKLWEASLVSVISWHP